MPHHKFVVFALVAFAAPLFVAGSPAAALPSDEGNDVEEPNRPRDAVIREDELMHKLNVKCGAKDVSSCVMLKLVTYVNQLMKKNSVELGDVVQIEKRDASGEDLQGPVAVEVPVGAGRALADESAFGRLMADKLWRYVRSRSLKIHALPDADVVVSASPEHEGSLDFGLSFRPSADGEQTGRGKNKNMGPMMAAMMMKMGMLKVMAFKFLALLVFKALFVSKLAFLLAVIIGLKKLFSQQKHVTYEVVAHPHHESHHGSDSYSSGWGRSSSEAAAHSMAYSGQVNP